jgi:hypothetical protein
MGFLKSLIVKMLLLTENHFYSVPQGTVRRASLGFILLKIIEAQSDGFLGEDGIVRFPGYLGHNGA